MGLKAGFLKNAVNPPGWIFECILCSRQGHAATPFLEHAIEAAKEAGWRQLAHAEGTFEYCPECAAKKILPEKCITGAV